MKENRELSDPYLGVRIRDRYRISERYKPGKIGVIYKAICTNPKGLLACKIIPPKNLRPGWKRELEKLNLLRSVPNIVPYHYWDKGKDRFSKSFTYVVYDFIDGVNLEEYLLDPLSPIDLTFIEKLMEVILGVLHACQSENLYHGDLHAGNILISKPDRRQVGNPRPVVYVTDFGYGGSHNNLAPKNDIKQLYSIISNILKRLDPAALNPRDRIMYQKLDLFLGKTLLEVDPTQGDFVGRYNSLLNDFQKLQIEAAQESSFTGEEAIKHLDDFLAAEAIGYRKDEWKSLFVPNFMAAEAILSRNIVVLTGARGCGKTMVFRRLTAYMDRIIGESSKVPGADQFVGFYLNCRDLVEAFPWLPETLTPNMEQQVINYFHLAWLAEFCKTFSLMDSDCKESYEWLDQFISKYFSKEYRNLPRGSNILYHVLAFIEGQKERCRITRLGSKGGYNNWPFAKVDLLDDLQKDIAHYVLWVGDRPLYLFLDDYTMPTITREVQRVLNPILFKRRSALFFKISTESAVSFMPSQRDKPLLIDHDYSLIDLATESLHLEETDKEKMLDLIFRPRIDRHVHLKGKNLGIADVLGKTPYSNNDLAKIMRDHAEVKTSPSVHYHGTTVFIGMWTSDVRTMIKMFVNMVRAANGGIEGNKVLINKSIQDQVYKTTGGRFLEFTSSVTNPNLQHTPTSTIPGTPFGKHLKMIVEAFVEVSRYELTQGKQIKNQGYLNPRQAFRIEIIDQFELTDKSKDYYEGLVRWHIFLQDWRGKSVRGMLTPRLFLNRILIPFVRLTFSGKDNIQLNNDEFNNLLTEPTDFPKYWRKKRKQTEKNPKQQELLGDLEDSE